MNPYVDLLICPICGGQFSLSGRTLMCARYHTYDIANDGYVNVNGSRQVGDTADMFKARRRFLERGHLHPLAGTIGTLATAHLGRAGNERAAILDAGCGEGHYLRAVKDLLGCQAAGHVFAGLDCSKSAVRMAAKGMRAAEVSSCFAVADLRDRVPFADSCVELLLSVFAPRNGREFARIVAPGGMLLVAIPTPQHLAEPRAALGLLDIEANKHARVVERLAPWFALAETRSLDCSVHLGREDLMDLVMMTPNYWHRTQVRWEALANITSQPTTIGVTVLGFRRRMRD